MYDLTKNPLNVTIQDITMNCNDATYLPFLTAQNIQNLMIDNLNSNCFSSLQFSGNSESIYLFDNLDYEIIIPEIISIPENVYPFLISVSGANQVEINNFEIHDSLTSILAGIYVSNIEIFNAENVTFQNNFMNYGDGYIGNIIFIALPISNISISNLNIIQNFDNEADFTFIRLIYIFNQIGYYSVYQLDLSNINYLNNSYQIKVKTRKF